MPCVVKEGNNDRIVDGSCTSEWFHMVVKVKNYLLEWQIALMIILIKNEFINWVEW